MVIVAATICLVVANVGLSQLIALSIPILMAVYPVAIALVLLTLVANRLRNPHLTYAVTLSVALMFGLLDGFSAAGFELAFLHSVRGFCQHFSHLL